jgi:Family of unknown function (DUF5829)
MKRILLATLLISTIALVSYKDSSFKSIPNPVSDLGHIDVILDSATWYAIRNDFFTQKEFGVLNNDTAYYGGKPSYDLYLLGHLNFLHISLAKGFWVKKEGSGVLVFQTRKPSMKDSLLNSWKQFYKDSLFIHTFKGTDFTLDEVMAWYKSDSSKPKTSQIFANLTTYSTDAYRNWGITDSLVNAGLSMKQFMEGWGAEDLKNKLFNSITELYMTINRQEYKEIRSALLATGYTEDKNIFSHPFNPKIYVTLSEEKGRSKYSRIKFSLNNSVENKEIVFSRHATLKLNGKEGWFIFN